MNEKFSKSILAEITLSLNKSGRPPYTNAFTTQQNNSLSKDHMAAIDTTTDRLKFLAYFFDALLTKFSATYLFIQNLSPEHKSMVDQLITQQTVRLVATF